MLHGPRTMLIAIGSAIAGAAVAYSAPGLLRTMNLPPDHVVSMMVADRTLLPSACVVGACALFFLLAFLLPALADMMTLWRTQRDLDEMARRQVLGTLPAPTTYLASFAGSDLHPFAERFAAALWNGDERVSGEGASSNWWSTVDAMSSFRAAADVWRDSARLFEKLFLLPLLAALCALSIVVESAAAGGTRLTAAVAVVGAGLGIAAVILVAARMTADAKRRRVTLIAVLSGSLFPIISGNGLLSQFAKLMQRESTMRNALIETAERRLGAAVADGFSQARQLVDGHDRHLADSVAVAVGRSTEPVIATIQALLGQLESGRQAELASVLRHVLTEFTADLTDRHGKDLATLSSAIATTRDLADELHHRIAAFGDATTERDERHGKELVAKLGEAIGDAGRAQSERIGAMLREAEGIAAGLRQVILQQASDGNAAIAGWASRIDGIAEAFVARSGAELQRTAAAFDQLHAILEALTVSVLPAINKLIVTQERLERTLRVEGETAQGFAAAASDLREATTASRDAVERHIVLAKELSRVASIPAARLHAVETQPVAVKPLKDVAQAIAALRAGMDDELRPLARPGDVG